MAGSSLATNSYKDKHVWPIRKNMHESVMRRNILCGTMKHEIQTMYHKVVSVHTVWYQMEGSDIMCELTFPKYKKEPVLGLYLTIVLLWEKL